MKSKTLDLALAFAARGDEHLAILAEQTQEGLQIPSHTSRRLNGMSSGTPSIAFAKQTQRTPVKSMTEYERRRPVIRPLAVAVNFPARRVVTGTASRPVGWATAHGTV